MSLEDDLTNSVILIRLLDCFGFHHKKVNVMAFELFDGPTMKNKL